MRVVKNGGSATSNQLVSKIAENGNEFVSWDGSRHYSFTSAEMGHLCDQVESVFPLVYDALDFLFEGEWGTLGLPLKVFEAARDSFDGKFRDEPDMFSRYDFAVMNDLSLRLVGTRGDDLSGFFNASYRQREWLWNTIPQAVASGEVSQANNAQEVLTSGMRFLSGQGARTQTLVLPDDDADSLKMLGFVKAVADKVGVAVGLSEKNEVIWSRKEKTWTNAHGNKVSSLFIHPSWDVLMSDPQLMSALINHGSDLNFMFEPLWKMVLSSRMVLAALWHLYPGHSILTPTQVGAPDPSWERYVKAPSMVAISPSETAVVGNRSTSTWGDKPRDLSGIDGIVYRNLDVPKTRRNSNNERVFLFISGHTIGGHLSMIEARESRSPMLSRHYTSVPHVIYR